jgi:hypothetical protein
MTKCVRNERNQVVDAGQDLNDPATFGEYALSLTILCSCFTIYFRYCKDIVILCTITHFISLFSSYLYWILIVLPGFGFYKLWVGILAPWVFAPAPEKDEANEKKQKKREKRINIRH